MAFSLKNFDKLSQEGLTIVPRIWGYRSATDSLATIKASAYFNNVLDRIAVADFIFINGSDGNGLVAVTSVTTNATVASITP